MPTIKENLTVWNSLYHWNDQGEEWSHSVGAYNVGGSDLFWTATLLPRINYFLPSKTILEIAPGMGRWTKFLKQHCDRLIIVDLSPKCIEACRQRFSMDNHILYYVNDGQSLDMIEDSSIDFVFSFDSLVHADIKTLEAYLKQLTVKLKPNGIGFIHHSNLKQYKVFNYLPQRVVNNDRYNRIIGWRDPGVSAKLFRQLCIKAKLQCLSQELIVWAAPRLFTDVLSIFRNGSAETNGDHQMCKNRNFMKQCDLLRRLASAAKRGLPSETRHREGSTM
jgi:ubiquinone/menaquinone biosynthesis C-methylase UbiE